MTVTLKHKILFVLTLVLFTASLVLPEEKTEAAKSAESVTISQKQEPKIKIEFSINEDSKPFLDYELAQLSIRPSHCARFFVEWRHIIPEMPSVEDILKNHEAAFVSEQQKVFLKTGKAFKAAEKSYLDADYSVEYIRGENYYYIYGVSQGDTVTTAKVFAEMLLINSNAKLQSALKKYVEKIRVKQKELQVSIEEIKQQIEDKRKLYEDAQTKAQKAEKNDRYDSLGIARDDILEFQKMLDTLNIELAGIRVSLELIENYKSEAPSEAYQRKLQEMSIEQNIELGAAEAKKDAVLSLLAVAKDYHDAITDFDKIKREIQELEEEQNRIDMRDKNIEKFLQGGPESTLLRPITAGKVYVWPLNVMY